MGKSFWKVKCLGYFYAHVLTSAIQYTKEATIVDFVLIILCFHNYSQTFLCDERDKEMIQFKRHRSCFQADSYTHIYIFTLVNNFALFYCGHLDGLL